MNLSKYLNKLCLFLIIIFIFLLFPVISYASFNNNAGGSSSSTASGNGLGNSTKTLYSDTSGYRITLIDPETGEVKSKSIDILFSAPPTDGIKLYNTSRVETTGYKAEWDYFLNTEIEQMLVLDGYDGMIQKSPIPRWFIRNGTQFSGDSNAFKNWFCPESAIDALSGYYDSYNKLEQSNQDFYDSVQGGPSNIVEITDNLETLLVDANNYVEAAKKALDGTITFDEAYDVASGVQRMMYQQSLRALGIVEKSPDDFVKFAESVRNLIYERYPSEIVKRGGFEDYPNDAKWLELKTKYSASSIIKGLFTMTSYATLYENMVDNKVNNSMSNIYIDEEKGLYNTEVYGWVLPLLRLEENGRSIFALNDTSGLDVNDYGGEEPSSGAGMANLFRLGNAYACVEPILFFKPQTSVNYPYTFWGTVKNYADFSVDVLAAWDEVALSGGNIFRGTNIVFPRSFILERNEGDVLDEKGELVEGLATEKHRTPFLQSSPYRGGKENGTELKTYGKYSVARYRGETLHDFMHITDGEQNPYYYGVGMHLYCVAGSGSSSSVNTYNIDRRPLWDDNTEPVHDKPDESEDYISINKNKTFQIVKFYRIRLGNGKYYEWNHYSRANTPHTIQITDEINIGWKLKEWFTSSSTWMPDANESPDKYPWESYVKQRNPLGTYSGTEAGRLVVNSYDPDNTLYLLYEAEEPSEQDDPGKVHTYDVVDNPSTPDESEDPKDKNDTSDYGSKSKTFAIDKHYRYKDSVTGKYTEISFFPKPNNPHTVVIMDEVQQTGYKLVDWFTSTDGWLPDTAKSPSDYPWETVVKGQHNNGTYRGTGETTLVVKPTDPDNVLHLLYEFVGSNPIKIVKIFKNSDDTINHTEGPSTIDRVPQYTVPEEDGYDYIESYLSENIPDVNNPNGDNTSNKSYSVGDDISTIYIIYKSPGQQIKLYSNELSYTYDLRDLVESRVLFSIYDTVSASPGTQPSCSGHYCAGRDCRGNSKNGYYCPGNHKCTLYNHRLDDKDWSIYVTNDYDYESKTRFIKDYSFTNAGGGKQGGTWITGTSGRAINSKSIEVSKPNGDFLLYRDKSKDLVTLYPNKNNSLLSTLKEIGITKISYTPSGSRMESEMTKDRSFTNHFETDFHYSKHDTKLVWNWSRSKCNTNRTGTYRTEVITTPDDANEYYSSNTTNVKEFYFVGESNNGLAEPSDSRDTSFRNKYKDLRGYSSTSAELKFYPYVKMYYRSKGNNTNKQSVYVTSENLSTMKVFNAIQAGVYKKNDINVNLTSTQWSTHARSLSFLKDISVDDKKSVLPGGAIQDLDMGNKGDTCVGVRVYQACLPDENVEKVQDGFKVSLTQAKQQSTALQNEISNVLKGYGLVQWGVDGVKVDMDEIRTNGQELHEDSDIDFVIANGGKSSDDAKYYLRHDGSGSSRANFDVLSSNIDSQDLYTIKSDTDGNVTISKNGSVMKTITVNQDASDMIGNNNELATLDDCTKLITNYIDAIDRGKGERNMYDRENNEYYNEAFDGVSVLVTNYSFDIGFSDNSGHRTNVLDPLLVGRADSKSDLYNFTDESKIRSSVYTTNLVSTTSTIKEEGYLGTLKGIGGMSDLKISLSDIYKLGYTKTFFIPNATVSDLN